MADRFSDITRAPELSKALDGYRAWLDPATKTSKRLTGGSRDNEYVRNYQQGLIVPFGVPVNTEFRGYAINYDALNIPKFAGFGVISGSGTGKRLRTEAVPAAEAGTWFIPQAGFKPAKVTVFVHDGGTPTYVQSKITKLYYLKYPGNSYSLPFGAASETEEASDGYSAVKNAMLAAYASGAKYRRVSIKSEILAV